MTEKLTFWQGVAVGATIAGFVSITGMLIGWVTRFIEIGCVVVG